MYKSRSFFNIPNPFYHSNGYYLTSRLFQVQVSSDDTNNSRLTTIIFLGGAATKYGRTLYLAKNCKYRKDGSIKKRQFEITKDWKEVPVI